MSLHPADLAIIALYLLVTVAIGFYVSRHEQKDLKSYFLGDNRMPWYLLGVSNASGMFDMAGTMWMVYLMFVYGVKSVWIPWLWPVFNQIFMMVYLSAWVRRSNALTGAEWIHTRFGQGRGAAWSHLSVVAFALLSVIGFLAYGFRGIGKFSATFVPLEFSADPELNANIHGILITGLTTLYLVKGGMRSVVFTELLQFGILAVASVMVGVIAMRTVSTETIAANTPEGWDRLGFGWTLGLDWSGILDNASHVISQDGYEMFAPFMMMVLFKGILVSMAGPAPNYDMQRTLSTRSPREAAKMSAVVNVVLLPPRYMLIAGLSVLALGFFMEPLRQMGSQLDFELLLPETIKRFVPPGLAGLLIAGLLAAFMSTFSATVNAAPAYLVNDIYKTYINPNASHATYLRLSYLASVGIVVVSTAFGLIAPTLNDVILWLVGGLLGGYTASNVLKWYWWRFNGYGYFWGMATGMLAALLMPVLLPEVSPVNSFPALLLISLAGCLAGTFSTPPEPMDVLKQFYRNVRPWGFWGPVQDAVMAEDPAFVPNRHFRRDMANVAVGIVWQLALTSAPVFLVLRNWTAFAAGLAVIAASSLWLRQFWWKTLEDR